MSSASDKGFLFLLGGNVPLPDPFASYTSEAGQDITAGRDSFCTETGTLMFTPRITSDCEFSDVALSDRPLGMFIVKGASTVVLFG
jgi:hypothetical protein